MYLVLVCKQGKRWSGRVAGLKATALRNATVCLSPPGADGGTEGGALLQMPSVPKDGATVILH